MLVSTVMSEGEAKKRTVNGVPRSLLLRPEQDGRLNRLLEAVEMNRNEFVKLCADKMTPNDVRDLQKR